ncbi:hypothetical protein EYF80_026970 [Liparis tanakae]|uniref:Uncharacterized protein n=1 Tax=Liparis tanakae TaxID=230148 RepID=A0A4Z2HCX8_9TELE|nr:hypothetical protein EYF80_026970 [Liparis tanakae]
MVSGCLWSPGERGGRPPVRWVLNRPSLPVHAVRYYPTSMKRPTPAFWVGGQKQLDACDVNSLDWQANSLGLTGDL